MIVDAPDHATIAAASVAINAYGAVKTKTIVLSAKAGKVTTHRIRLLRLVQLHESAGVPATISSVDLVFMSGATAVVSSHYDQPSSDTSNVCPANGTVDTREPAKNGTLRPRAQRHPAAISGVVRQNQIAGPG